MVCFDPSEYYPWGGSGLQGLHATVDLRGRRKQSLDMDIGAIHAFGYHSAGVHGEKRAQILGS